ncbi:MAG: extracellular solute-binding protein [Clostridia bacterium]|nr:extracellular solute-binding protein [Clostridia bacterium]
MKKKLIALVLALSVFATLLSACGIGTVKDPNGTESNIDYSNATQLSIATWDGGLGSKWLEDAARRFEILNQNTSFEDGKTGCHITIAASRSFDGSSMAFTPLTHDIYFVEAVDYYAMTNNDQMADLTGIMTKPLTAYGEDRTILDKIPEALQDFLCIDGKYYAIPFYESFYSFAYDLDLWNSKSFYFAKDGSFTNASGDLSEGPDGKAGTSDDGMPATYADFAVLVDHIKDEGVTPFICAANATDYIANFLYEYYANYEGAEQMALNFTFDGTATDLIEVSESGKVTELPAEQIEWDNGYELQRQAGRYYSLQFAHDILTPKDNYKMSDTHINAQKSYVRGGIVNDQPIAMILEGSWWENEAKACFKELNDGKYDRHNYAVMPKPHATEDKIGQTPCWLGASSSYGFIANNTAHMDLALAFMEFLHTDEELSHFTAEVNMTRPLDYPVTKEDSEKLTTYCKSILEIKETGDVIYPYTNREEVLDNPLQFASFAWAWTTSVDGYEYRNPWLYFSEVSDGSAEDYFSSQEVYFETRWDGF